MRIIYFLTLSIVILLNTSLQAEKVKIDEAEKIYKKYGETIYQIQVIDKVSNKKSSIGSGFQISENGYIATNYHVISEFIQKPDSNHIEYLTDDGKRGKLEIISADIVHDLAIVKKTLPKIEEKQTKELTQKNNKTWLKLGQTSPSKGAKIFSLGNPHDIGFTIIEGTYNGISKKSLYEKIHFSGSLNPGMSGGPALDHNGNVIGINVATAGNQISFLVPVEHLSKLYKAINDNKDNFIKKSDGIILEQLQNNQKRFISDLISKEWETMSFGSFNIPGKISNIFKCWGGQRHEEKDLYKHFYSVCSSQDSIYLEQGFRTGLIRYNYDYIKAKKELNTLRFYNLYETLYSNPSGSYYYNAEERNVTEFSCNDDFVSIANKKWKSSFCVRQYKKYPSLFDLNLYMATIESGNEGLLISLVAQGVDQKSALRLSKKFLNTMSPIAISNTKGK